MSKIRLGFIALFFALTWGFSAFAQDSCMECHSALEDKLSAPVGAMEAGDVHKQNKFSCADCHGGDPKTPGFDAMDPAKGFIGVPRGIEIADVCGRCHSNADFMRRFKPTIPVDQEVKYRVGAHGKLVSKGDEKAATCSSCHRAHGILPPEDIDSPINPLNIPATCGRCHADPQYMADYKIPTDQLEKFKRGVHGQNLLARRDPSSPSCATCHGKHNTIVPPPNRVAAVCGDCHPVEAELFDQSPHKAAYRDLGIPECAACHDNHENKRTDDEMIGTDEKSICIACHDSESRGYKAASAMKSSIDNLKSRTEEAKRLVTKAERAGMEVSDGRARLVDAEHFLVQIRVAIHGVSPEQVDRDAKEGVGLADRALEVGRKAMAELQFRRRGLAISLVLIAIVIVGLYLKIKDIERKEGRK